MASVFELMSERLRSIDFQIDGRDASEPVIESLFRVGFRAFPLTQPLPLLPRLCEEHLTAALVTSRQAIEDRQAYLTTGERFAALTLSLDSDTNAADLLKTEAEAMELRHGISKAALTAEKLTDIEVNEQFSQMAQFSASLDPTTEGGGPAGDAARNAWLSYISRSVNHGYDSMAGYWGAASQTDKAPVAGVPEYVMSPTEPVVSLESELSRRATLAAFRVMHERSFVEKRTAYTAVVASKGRLDTLGAAAKFDEAAAALALARSTKAEDLIRKKTAMSRDLALLDFKAQMELHRRRAQDHFLEAMERATAALSGLRKVYGFALPDIPAATLETAESLLFWCRDVARILLGFDPRVAKQILTISAVGSIGNAWRSNIALGITIDATSLQNLGYVVRLRNVGVRFTGLSRSGFPVRVTPPDRVTDRNAQGIERDPFDQPVTSIPLLATPVIDQDVTGRRTSARIVHNLCPSGLWTIQATDLPGSVDDLLLDLDISYLVAEV